MKKIFMIAAIALLTLGMVSCNKDDDNTNNNTPTNPNVPDGYIDLGLPSGLLWATCNLGSTTPEGYGNYYAWGEVCFAMFGIGQGYGLPMAGLCNVYVFYRHCCGFPFAN